MRTTEEAHRWEVKGLERRLESIEDRLDRRDQERFRNSLWLIWIVWGAVIAGMVVLAALN